MYKVYGIKNCDTVKKALKKLDSVGIEYDFVDFKKTPPTKEMILRWKDFMGTWPVNTKGPTYRKIKDEFESITDAKKIALLIDSSSAIKRPIVEKKGKVLIAGFDDEVYGKFKK